MGGRVRMSEMSCKILIIRLVGYVSAIRINELTYIALYKKKVGIKH